MAAKITRRVTVTTVTFAWTEMTETEGQKRAVFHDNEVRTIPGKLSETQVNKFLKKEYPAATSIMLLGMTEAENLYEMPLETFVSHATIAVKDPNKPDTEDAESDGEEDDGEDGTPEVPTAPDPLPPPPPLPELDPMML